MSGKTFTDAFEFVYENSIFEKYKTFEDLKPSDITEEKIKILEELKTEAGYVHDYAVYGLRGIGELMSMAFSDRNIAEGAPIGDDLWRVVELIVNLTDMIERFDISQHHLDHVINKIEKIRNQPVQ